MKLGMKAVMAVCVALVAVSSVQASVTPLGDSGWSMIVSKGMQPVDTPYIFGTTNGALSIELHKTFNVQRDSDGYFTPIVIEFMKTSANALSKISINDEYITNATGTTWDGFDMQLMVNTVNPQAGFNPVAVDGDQLENVSYSLNAGYNGEPILLKFRNGQGDGVTSALDDAFKPGLVVGSILIDVNPNLAVGTRIGLKEIPIAMPEPATMMMLGLGGLSLLRKKRKQNLC